MSKPLYQALASLVAARIDCIASPDARLKPWVQTHADHAESLVRDYMPSGSGFDSGTKLYFDASSAEKLVFTTSFHHMDEHGGYDVWTHHKVTVRASLVFGFTLTISGRDRNGFKDYAYDVFDAALSQEVAS